MPLPTIKELDHELEILKWTMYAFIAVVVSEGLAYSIAAILVNSV